MDGIKFFPIRDSDLNLAAHLFSHSRLTTAREFRGISRNDLAKKVGKSPSAIGQFETGRIKPDAQTLAKISLGLGFPVSFFAERPNDYFLSADNSHFRSLRSATQNVRRRVLSAGSILAAITSVFEERVNFPPEEISTLSREIQTNEEIELLAESARAAWGLGLGPISNIVKLLESKGVLVTEVPSDCEAIDAFSTWAETRPMVFLLGGQPVSRIRFDAAHELGHLFMHADAIPGCANLERQAHRFAGAFLFPREPFLRECPRWLKWDQLFELKTRWKISVAAIVKRAFDLGVFTEYTYKRAFMFLNQKGYREQEPHEPAEIERPTMVQNALNLIIEDESLSEILSVIGLNERDFSSLVGISTMSENRNGFKEKNEIG